MPVTFKGSQIVPLSLFAGLCLNVEATNLPSGVSWLAQDVDFEPQKIFTRAGFNKLYTSSLPFPILYCSQYNKTSDEIYNLFLDNQGNVYIEDVINTPGQYVMLMSGLVSPGDYTKIITADPGGIGLVRAWFASFSGGANGLDQGGSDIPTYFDGSNFTRVTQDGPASIVTISDNVANIAINYITQPALIGPSANAAPLTLEPTTINFYNNTSGIYTGAGAQTNPNPYLNGTSLILNQPIGNFPIKGYYGKSTGSTFGQSFNFLGDSYSSDTQYGVASPVSQQEQDNFGNWTNDVAFPQTAIGGSTGYGFDCNIQGNFVVSTPGTYTFYFQVNDSWILYMGNGATYQFGPQVGSAISHSGNPYIASRLNLGKLGSLDTVVINFPTIGAYPFEIGYSNLKGLPSTYCMVTMNNGNVATQASKNSGPVIIGNNILPTPGGSGAIVTEAGTTATIIFPVPHPFGVNDQALIQGFDIVQYNGLQTVTSVPDQYTFTYELDVSGLTIGHGGTVAPVTATCYTLSQHNLILNDAITISGNTQNLYCTAYSNTFSNVTTVNPALWNVSGIIDPYTFQFNTEYNVGKQGNLGFIGGAGLISPGIHKVCCSFLLDDGSITAPSQISQWNSTGYKKFTIQDLPIGPPNVKGRILHFTGASGASFFDIPTTPFGQQNLFGGQTAQVPIGMSTVINDNTTTSVVLDFADATLFGGTAVDIAGNNLFAQVTLGPSIGVIEYADRLFWWGEINKVQTLLNMGFNGNYNINYTPGGWSAGDSPNSTLAYDNLQGFSYCITGNASVNQQGIISQSAYQDQNNVSILQPNQLYRFKVKLTPTVLQYITNITQQWNYADYLNQNFTGAAFSTQFSKVDPFNEISINGISGLSIAGGNGVSGTSYYQYNNPVEIPTITTPGFLISGSNSNTTIISNTYPIRSLINSQATATTNGIVDANTSNTVILTGFPNVSTVGISSLTLSYLQVTSASLSNDPQVGLGEAVFSLSFDNGNTFPQILGSVSFLGSTATSFFTYNIPINDISTKTTNLNNLALKLFTYAYVMADSNPGETMISNGILENIVVTATQLVTTPAHYLYETGNISLFNINLNPNSTGNILTLYNQSITGNSQINPSNAFIGINIQPNNANSSSKLYLNYNQSETLIVDIPTSQNPFNVIMSATPQNIANVSSTLMTFNIVPTLGSNATISTLVPYSNIANVALNYIIADNANITGNILSSSIANWPVDISSQTTGSIPKQIGVSANTVLSGSIVSSLYSPSIGSAIATATIPLNILPTDGEFVEAVFSKPTGPVIPSDLLLQIYAQNMSAGQTIALNDAMLIPDNYPVNETSLISSYIANPTAYDDETGKIEIPIAGEKIINCFKLRDILYIITDHYIFQTQDNPNSEPSQWVVSQLVNASVGGIGPYCVGQGRKNSFILDRSGLWSCTGTDPILVSEEILPGYILDTINWPYAHTSWVFNDVQQRRTYFAVPVNGSTIPNLLILVNTKGLDPAYDSDLSEPIHASTFTGKLISNDKSIKFATWSPQINYTGLLNVDASQERTTFCGSKGNMYYLNSKKYQDDDYGTIQSQYATYFFITETEAQQLQLDSSQKLYTYLTAAFTGIGDLIITPFVNNTTSNWQPLSSRTLSEISNDDFNWNLNIKGSRVSFLITVNPDSNGDAAFSLTKMSCYLQNNPTGLVRGR